MVLYLHKKFLTLSRENRNQLRLISKSDKLYTGPEFHTMVSRAELRHYANVLGHLHGSVADFVDQKVVLIFIDILSFGLLSNGDQEWLLLGFEAKFLMGIEMENMYSVDSV
jgi:hypothetical protein